MRHKIFGFSTIVITCLILILGVILAGGSFFWLKKALYDSGPLLHTTRVDIPSGTSIKHLGRILKKNKVIHSDHLFEIGARLYLHQGGKAPQAGEYDFPAGISLWQSLEMLSAGGTVLHQITIPEGYTNNQIKTLLDDETKLSGAIDFLPPEGFLLPETYSFRKGFPRQDLIAQMHKAKLDILNRLWQSRAENLPLMSRDEAVILASIIEKETGIKGERSKISGVFINRLRKNMRLQSDPTVIYAITDGVAPEETGQGALGRRLLRKDLNFDSPYNTYKYAGLPPGAICNAGKASLMAALNPQSHQYLYFVADGSGGHVFSKTLAEHNRNVAKWRKIRAKKK